MAKIVKRDIEGAIGKVLKSPEIIGIRGARQVGKTTLLKELQKITPNARLVDMDLPDNRRELEEHPLDFAKRFGADGKTTLMLDEIQKVKDAGERIKTIYDNFESLKLFISGSSSLEIKANVLPELVGRIFMFELFTFSFAEFLSYMDEGLHKIFEEKKASLLGFIEKGRTIEEPSFSEQLLRRWKDYTVFGGYPRAVVSDDQNERVTVLKNIYSMYLEKDIAAFFHIKDTASFEDFTRALAFNIASITSVSSAASDVKVSYATAADYLNILSNTYVIKMLAPFHKNISTEIKKAKKVYFLDLGLRNAAMNNFSEFDTRSDGGQIAENFVFRELLTAGYEIRYWRTAGNAEIDFVIRLGSELVPVEVKLGYNETLGRGFHSFLGTYKPKRALIITLDAFERKVISGTTIYWVPITYL